MINTRSNMFKEIHKKYNMLHTIKLYEKSIEKWEYIIEYKQIEDVFKICSFCEDVMFNDKYESLHIDGNKCCHICKINKDICGSVTSLLVELDTYLNRYYGYDMEQCYNLAKKILNALKKELNILKKKLNTNDKK